MDTAGAVTPTHAIAASTTATSPTTAAQRARQRELKRTIGEMVGTVFFEPILRSVRTSKLKGTYGHGGRGEEIFSAQLHELMAKAIGRSQNFGINEALYRRFADRV